MAVFKMRDEVYEYNDFNKKDLRNIFIILATKEHALKYPENGYSKEEKVPDGYHYLICKKPESFGVKNDIIPAKENSLWLVTK